MSTLKAASAAPATKGSAAENPQCEPGAGGWPGVPPHKKVKFDFTLETKGFLHDHKRIKPLESLQVTETCDTKNFVYDGSFTVSPVGGGDKADKDAITVSGTVTLPKAKDAKP
jgi:hypothetical protein